MALVDINITLLIKHYMHFLVTTSNYEQLRAYLLQRETPAFIMNSVAQELENHLYTDKQDCQSRLVAEACAKQLEADQSESLADRQEEKQDEELYAKYNAELPELASRLDTLNDLIIKQKNRSQPLQTTDKELKHKMHQLDDKLKDINRQKNNLTTQYLFHNLGHQHHHSHKIGPKVQVHHHCPNNLDIWDVVHQSQWHSLQREEAQLQEKKTKLQRKIEDNSLRLSSEHEHLRQLQNEQHTIQTKHAAFQKALDTELPQKLLQRQQKAAARELRQNARQFHDPHLLQLSPQHKNAYEATLQTLFQALESRKESLIKETRARGYKIFMDELDAHLLMNNISLTHPEKEALSTISALMKTYLEKAALAENLRHTLVQEEIKLLRLKQKQKETLELTRQNNELKEQRIAHNKKHNYSMLTSMMFLCAAVVIGALIIALSWNPFLWAIPAAAGVAGLITFTYSIVQYVKTANRDKKIQQNIETMNSNETSLVERHKHGHGNAPKPSLQEQIDAQEQCLRDIRTALLDCTASMALTLGKAQNTVCISPSLYPEFTFAVPPIPQISELVPSAPPAYNPQFDFQSSGFNLQ